jgi:tetratricopeptide (TPR) repeat protein
MKAKWAFKRGNELFGELAEKAKAQKDTESEMKYYRFQAMCLEKWGAGDESRNLYKQVINHYLQEASKEEKNGNKELQAVSLEEAAGVLDESGDETEAKKHLERALELYVELADESSTSGDPENGSKLYSKAAECALKLGNNDRYESFRWVASEKAENAAEYYQELGVPELATIWIRTAGMEALVTNSSEMLERAIVMLTQSGEGFKVANEPKEAFEDFFTVFETRFMHYPEMKRPIKATIKMMDEVAVATQDEVMLALMSLVRALNTGNHIGALLILQENEEALLDKAKRIRALIARSKIVRPVK